MSNLNSVLERYKDDYNKNRIAGGGEEDFIGKHKDNIKVTSAPGANTNTAKNKKIDRKKHKKGYETGEDEDMYEENEELNEIIDQVIEMYYLENSDEDIASLEEMLESKKGQEEFMDILIEEIEASGEYLEEEEEIDPPMDDKKKVSAKDKKKKKCDDCGKYPCECEED